MIESAPKKENNILTTFEKNGLKMSIFKHDSMIFMSVSENGQSLPDDIKEVLLEYTQKNVLLESGNIGRDDCASVAGKAVRSLESYFEKKGFAIYTIGTGTGKSLLPFFAKLGYGHHVVNVIEGEKLCAAIDLTAGYTLDENQQHSDVFAIVGNSVAEIEHSLENITDSKWEAR